MTLVISKVFTYDDDAATYIQAVEAADGQALEGATRKAINNFVIGCKQDNIWSAFEQCGILCGARTRQGAVIPLVKPSGNTDPTFAGTAGGWVYDRKIGLNGNGTDNYVDTKYIIPAGNQNNAHISTWRSNTTSGGGNAYHIGAFTAGLAVGAAIGNGGMYSNNGVAFSISADGDANNNVGLHVWSRTASNLISFKRPGYITKASSATSSTPATASAFLFTVSNNGTPSGTTFSSAPLAFYSSGKSINIDLLDARVTALINAFAAAIP